MKKQMVLLIGLVFVLAACGGGGGDTPVMAPQKTNGAKISCMNTTATCGASAKAITKSFWAFLPDFIPTAQADIVTQVTTFQGTDLHSGQFATLYLTVENIGTEIFTGYIYTDLSFPGWTYNCGLAGGPVSLQPGESKTTGFGCGISSSQQEAPLGAYSLSSYVYVTTSDPNAPCAFTVDDSNIWTGLQVQNWIQTCNPTPAAIGTINFNIIAPA